MHLIIVLNRIVQKHRSIGLETDGILRMIQIVYICFVKF